MRMHQLLVEHRDAYDDTTKSEKTKLSATVLQKLKQLGCRFLAAAPGGFVECDDYVAREKISHGFRNLRLSDKNKTSGNISSDKSRSGHTNARKRNLGDDFPTQPFNGL
jgi:hypothetical protein